MIYSEIKSTDHGLRESRSSRSSFAVTDRPIDTDALTAQLENHAAGAFVAFEGRVRKQNDGRKVDRLEYELFSELCEEEGRRILEEARELFALIDVQAVHRYGMLELGDAAVWVGVISKHRGGAFQACRYIIDAIKARCPIWKKEYYVDGPTEWIGCATCESHAVSYDKVFSRQQRLLGEKGQEALAHARVLIVGMGGLGCPAALHLAAAGVGFLRLMDGDTLDATNLHRQTLYGYHDVGSYKAVLARRRLEDLHPFTKMDAVTERLTPQNAARFLEDIDLVLDCTDNFSTKYLINDSCVERGLPFVQASIYQNQAQLMAYRPESSACLRCLRPEQPPADCVESCTDSGVLGAGTSIVGSHQAMEALRLILAQPSVSVTHTVHLDLELLDNFSVKRTIDPKCPACGEERLTFDYSDHSPLIAGEYTMSALREWKNAIWVDIREAHEGPSPMPEAHRLPLSTLDRQFFANHTDQSVVIFCQKGHRSRALLQELRTKGYTHVSALKGGLEAVN